MLCDQPRTQRNGRKAAAPMCLEKAMKRFYARFKSEHAAFLACLEGVEEQAARERYAFQLLISTLFVYFIQRKGILNARGPEALNGDCNYLLHQLHAVQRQRGKGHFHTFYRSFLSRLFHEGCEPQQPLLLLEVSSGNVPYLHGDLLDISTLEDDYHTAHLPDEAFERLFGFLDEYEWCLDDGSLSNEKELGPDVIGSVFEKYSNQKQMGAYYTQTDVTEYISKNSIIPRLLTTVAQKCPDLFAPPGAVWTRLRADPERYVYVAVKHGCALPLPPEIEGGINDVARRIGWDTLAPQKYGLPKETWREVVARRQRYEQLKTYVASGEFCSIDELVTYNLDICQFARDIILSSERSDVLAAFYASLVELTILDPTCGAGAFLFAALTLLEPLYIACLERMQWMVDAQEQQLIPSGNERERLALGDFRELLGQAASCANRRFFIQKSIIMRNLYGVDIMREATEICKLRLFLKLVLQIETFDEIKTLAAITFNIRAGNALVGFATYREATRIAESNPGGLLFSRTMWRRIMRQVREVEHQLAVLQQSRLEHYFQAGLTVNGKNSLHTLFMDLRDSLDRYLAAAYGIDPHTIPRENEQAERFASWRAAFQPFHWLVECYEIMQRGGFDVIIGNPPYVAYNKVKDTYQLQFYETQTCGNLCSYVLERAVTLLRPDGRCGMIMPVSAISGEHYRSLNQLLRAKQLWISSYSNRPGKLFAGVEQRLAIMLLDNREAQALLASAYRHWYEPERVHLFATLTYTAASTWETTGMPLKSGSSQAEAIFARLTQRRGFPLLHNPQPGAAVWVHNGPTYWVRALPFEPNTEQGGQRSDHYWRVPVNSQEKAFVLAAILSSSTFYFFYKLISNCRDLGRKELCLFPLGKLHPAREERLARLGRLLAQRLKDTAERRTRRYASERGIYEVSYEEYYPARARELLDEIDRVLAEHYGFSDEELDFLLHCDLKYRQGIK